MPLHDCVEMDRRENAEPMLQLQLSLSGLDVRHLIALDQHAHAGDTWCMGNIIPAQMSLCGRDMKADVRSD